MHHWACRLGAGHAAGPRALLLGACVRPSHSFLLPSSHVLLHSANMHGCYLVAFPTHFTDGKRKAAASTQRFSSPRLAASLPYNCRAYYYCIFYTYTHTHIYVFLYIYIFFSLPVQLRDTTGIYLCNEKREIGRSKGIFL